MRSSLLVRRLQSFEHHAFSPESFLLRASCLDVLRALPAGVVDLIIADPPYGLSNGGTTNSGGRRVAVDKGAWDRSPSIESYYRWTLEWLHLAQRALKPSGTIWITATHHALFAIGYAMQRLGFNVLNLVTWYKPNAAPNLGCRQLTHSSECAIWAAPRVVSPLAHVFHYQDLRKANGGKQLRDVWEISAGAPKHEKLHGPHPTQKPLELIERMIRASSSPLQLVLDPFLGSGTTAVAARALGRRVIGVELEPKYFALARARVEETRTRRAT